MYSEEDEVLLPLAIPTKLKSGATYSMNDFYYLMGDQMAPRFFSAENMPLVSELLYAVTGKELSEEAKIYPNYDLSMPGQDIKVHALVEDIDRNCSEEKIELLKSREKMLFNMISDPGMIPVFPPPLTDFGKLRSMRKRVFYAINVQSEYYSVYHGKGKMLRLYDTALCARFSDDEIFPDFNLVFINARSEMGLVIAKTRIQNSAGQVVPFSPSWHEFNVDHLMDAPKKLSRTLNNPVAEAFYYIFNFLHREDLLRAATKHIQDPRARNDIELAVRFMNKQKEDAKLKDALLKSGICYCLPDEFVNRRLLHGEMQ